MAWLLRLSGCCPYPLAEGLFEFWLPCPAGWQPGRQDIMGSSTHVLPTCVGDPDGVPGSWLWSGPAQPRESIGQVKQEMTDLSCPSNKIIVIF